MRGGALISCVISVSIAMWALPDLSYANQGGTSAGERESKRKNRSKESKQDSESEAAEDSGDTDGETPEQIGSEQNAESTAGSDVQAEQGALRRSGRMEFDERLVKGQAAKSGAVYLFKRVPRRLPDLVPLRTSYRKRIVEPVLGDRELKQGMISVGDGSQTGQGALDSSGRIKKGDKDTDSDENAVAEDEQAEKGKKSRKRARGGGNK